MSINKKIFIFIFSLLGMMISENIQAQNSRKQKLETPAPTVDFSKKEIEKVKTLIEYHLKTRISEAQFSQYGNATEENLALFKLLNETQKENAFFSQDHISYIIESMEFRLGKNKPKSKMNTPTEKRDFPKVSKLPKHKRDNS